VLPITVNEADVSDMLTRAGLLDPAHEHSREEIAAAMERIIAGLCEQPS
jgi:hypothetical protein